MWKLTVLYITLMFSSSSLLCLLFIKNLQEHSVNFKNIPGYSNEKFNFKTISTTCGDLAPAISGYACAAAAHLLTGNLLEKNHFKTAPKVIINNIITRASLAYLVLELLCFTIIIDGDILKTKYNLFWSKLMVDCLYFLPNVSLQTIQNELIWCLSC